MHAYRLSHHAGRITDPPEPTRRHTLQPGPEPSGGSPATHGSTPAPIPGTDAGIAAGGCRRARPNRTAPTRGPAS